MAGVNKVILVGNVGKAPEVKHLAGGQVVANFPLATSERWKNKQGEYEEATEWHNCEVWGNTAKAVESFVGKGSKLYVEGKIKTESWESDGGTKYRTKIRVMSLTMLDAKKDNQAPQAQPQPKPQPQAQPVSNVGVVDDIPF